MRTRAEASLACVPRRRRPRVLVLNQYYWPGVEATAQLLTELCEALAEEVDVKVVTGVLHGHEDEPHRLVHRGVQIVRVPSTSFERSRFLARAANYVTYLSNALLRGLRGPRPDVVLCMTDPPIVADVALLVARRFRAPLVVISQDVFPEIAVQLRHLEDPIIPIIGTGARHAELVALAERLEVDRVLFLYYQNRDVLPQSLSAADVHVVGLAAGLAGYVVPSRLYGILAVGRPVIAAADADSETAQVVEQVGCGIVVPPGRPELLARAARDGSRTA